jgi:hypothetical protein
MPLRLIVVCVFILVSCKHAGNHDVSLTHKHCVMLMDDIESAFLRALTAGGNGSKAMVKIINNCRRIDRFYKTYIADSSVLPYADSISQRILATGDSFRERPRLLSELSAARTSFLKSSQNAAHLNLLYWTLLSHKYLLEFYTQDVTVHADQFFIPASLNKTSYREGDTVSLGILFPSPSTRIDLRSIRCTKPGKNKIVNGKIIQAGPVNIFRLIPADTGTYVIDGKVSAGGVDSISIQSQRFQVH